MKFYIQRYFYIESDRLRIKEWKLFLNYSEKKKKFSLKERERSNREKKEKVLHHKKFLGFLAKFIRNKPKKQKFDCFDVKW